MTHTLISHDIALLEGVAPSDFEAFVQERDYAACSDFPSLVSFVVVRSPDNPRHFRELIHARDMDSFNADMETPTFRALETEFVKLATVISESVETVVGAGYPSDLKAGDL